MTAQVESALRSNPKTRRMAARIEIRLWADGSGRVNRVVVTTIDRRRRNGRSHSQRGARQPDAARATAQGYADANGHFALQRADQAEVLRLRVMISTNDTTSRGLGTMFDMTSNARWREVPLAVSLCALLCANPAFAQSSSDQTVAPAKKSDAKKPSVSQAKPTSPNVSINLINLMVKRGLLKEDEAQGLIKQADDEAYVSRQAAKDASAKADEAAKTASAAASAANPPGTRHVTYVPEIVKRQLREED